MKNKSLAVLFVAVSAVVIIVAAAVGSANINLLDIVSILLHKTLKIPLMQHIESTEVAIIWTIRLPRVFLAFCVGAVLSASGACVQSILKNPLASPYTLGVSSGASLGAAIVFALGFTLPILPSMTLPLTGLVFGILTVLFVITFTSKFDKNLSNNTIVLAGMVFSLFFNGILTTIMAIAREDLKTITLWQMGSFSMKGSSYLLAGLPFFIFGTIGILLYTKELDLFSFGENEAKALGVNTKKVKRNVLILSAILTGSAVSLTGTIGFVDLVSPHVVRRIFGPKHRYVIPMSMLFGGCLMVITDLIARTIISPAELPVGAITALIGAPFFAYIYFKKSKKK